MRKVLLLLPCLFLSILLNAQEDEVTERYGEKVLVDGLSYYIDKTDNTAMIANGNQWTGELDIPEQIAIEGETYTVTRILWLAFDRCSTLTRVRIPKTVSEIKHYAGWEDCKNPFNGCTSLEAIEVDGDNPWMSSENGVLFNKDKTRLFCYPAGAGRETYRVPESVSWIGMNAFACNPYLISVHIPNSVTRMCGGTFCGCKKLSSVSLPDNIHHIDAYTFDRCESLSFLDIPASVEGFSESVFRWSSIKILVIRGTFPNGLRDDTFYFVNSEAVAYVLPSEIEKFEKVFPGTVLPLDEYLTDIDNPVSGYINSFPTYDLQGRQLPDSEWSNSRMSKGIYIRDGRKVVVK